MVDFSISKVCCKISLIFINYINVRLSKAGGFLAYFVFFIGVFVRRSCFGACILKAVNAAMRNVDL